VAEVELGLPEVHDGGRLYQYVRNDLPSYHRSFKPIVIKIFLGFICDYVQTWFITRLQITPV
jgi:hypothetical protein